MYKMMWNFVNKMKVKRKRKHHIYILLNTFIFGMIGFLLWLIFSGRIYTNRLAWFLSFVGYPAVVLGFIVSVFALFKYD